MEVTKTQHTLASTYHLLRYTFVVVPLVAGLDKFTHILTNWEQYLNPSLADALPFSPSTFLKMVGVIEIIAGLIVLAKPKIGGYIVAAWLTAIALTLLAGWSYPDIAVRDLVMAIAAFSMARLSGIKMQAP